MPEAKLKITLIKSPIGYAERQKRTVRALGLRHLHQTVELADSQAVRGMIAKVSHMLKVEPVCLPGRKVEGSHETA
jgi:large subunit ribosomal protein L30